MSILATGSANRALFGGIGCVVLTALLVMIGAAQIRGREAAGGQDFTLEVPDASLFPAESGEDDIPMPAPSGENADQAQAPELPAPPMPAAQQGGVAAGTSAGGETRQTAPPEPQAAPAQPTPRFNAAAVPVVAEPPVSFARPIVLAAGRFSIAGKVLELEGVLPVAVNRQCQDSAGEGWPCGRMARTAFANLVRGRTIDCAVPAKQWSGTVTARCTVAGKDLSQWLAENGWAEAAPGSPFEEAADAARQAGLGLHSPNPRGKATQRRDGPAGGEPANQTLPQQP